MKGQIQVHNFNTGLEIYEERQSLSEIAWFSNFSSPHPLPKLMCFPLWYEVTSQGKCSHQQWRQQNLME